MVDVLETLSSVGFAGLIFLLLLINQCLLVIFQAKTL